MLVAVAVVPQTPLLVPEIASGAAGELDGLRRAVLEAVREVTASADRVAVVAPGPAERTYERVEADFSAFGYVGGLGRDHTGAPRDVTNGPPAGSALPLGAWLLDAAGVTLPRRFHETAGDKLDLGEGRTALIVLADGSAKRDEAAPGYVDVRAVAFDAAIATALAGPDLDVLAGLDRELAASLWASGVPALIALAATARGEGEAGFTADLRYDDAPYGVGYWVATWTS